ncbi:MAG TPA: GNAT family N-acetyltransferase [Usitatibacter sp.]|nr:GNAT family N-acetyltransferase [Usitatibacter sp.]
MLGDGFAPELERVRLRPLEARDAPALYTTYADPETSRYLSRPPMTGLGEAEALLARAQAGREEGHGLQLAIERIGDGAFLGVCLLFHIHAESARAEIGYTLAREHWSRGYMAEALPALVGYAFGPLGLNRLEADIDPRNAASARVLERLGFSREGLLRERWIVAGEASDSAIYGLLRREWRAR